MERTQVAIIGGGPAGLLLSHMLDRNGVDSVVLERQSRAHVLGRIRAGVLEHGTVQLLRMVGLDGRMEREGQRHDGTLVVWEGRPDFFIDTRGLTGKRMMAFGQTAITEELYAARDRAGGQILDEVEGVTIDDVLGTRPRVRFTRRGRVRELACDFVAGCDGFHGVSRQSIPARDRREFRREYPFGWLGVLSSTPPLENILYARHHRGFALASQRGTNLSRYYIQCGPGTRPEDWPDERFWDELRARLPRELADRVVTGPSLEKSVAPLRSFVGEPMRYGKLFLAGDASHIVPPTGAKGLNLAVSDVFYLHRALVEKYTRNNDAYLESYSATTLRRVWAAERLSWWLTMLLHEFPERDGFDDRLRENEFDHLCRSRAAQTALAEQYVGLPYEA